MYIQGVLPWKSAEWVAPPPEEIARIRANAGTAEGELERAESGIQPQVSAQRGLGGDGEGKGSLDSESTTQGGEKMEEREEREARENAAAAEHRE